MVVVVGVLDLVVETVIIVVIIVLMDVMVVKLITVVLIVGTAVTVLIVVVIGIIVLVVNMVMVVTVQYGWLNFWDFFGVWCSSWMWSPSHCLRFLCSFRWCSTSVRSAATCCLSLCVRQSVGTEYAWLWVTGSAPACGKPSLNASALNKSASSTEPPSVTAASPTWTARSGSRVAR